MNPQKGPGYLLVLVVSHRVRGRIQEAALCHAMRQNSLEKWASVGQNQAYSGSESSYVGKNSRLPFLSNTNAKKDQDSLAATV